MIKLLEKYPKAAKVVRDYYLEKMIESLKAEGLPDDFKEHVREQGITNEKIAKLIDGNSRSLFDVFDENGIIIEIINSSIFPKIRFTYKINSLAVPFLYDTRKEAEKEVVKDAFNELENKL